MGSFNMACMVTNASITYGEDMVVFLVDIDCDRNDRVVYNYDHVSPIGFPIFAKYNDYGGLEPGAKVFLEPVMMDYIKKNYPYPSIAGANTIDELFEIMYHARGSDLTDGETALSYIMIKRSAYDYLMTRDMNEFMWNDDYHHSREESIAHTILHLREMIRLDDVTKSIDRKANVTGYMDAYLEVRNILRIDSMNDQKAKPWRHSKLSMFEYSNMYRTKKFFEVARMYIMDTMDRKDLTDAFLAEYATNFEELSRLNDMLMILNIQWKISHYSGQEVSHKAFKEFYDFCSSMIDNERKKWDEEYGNDEDEDDDDAA